jgi:hypothetical protein
VDNNHDGTLDRASFVVGMWLVDQCLYGRKLPPKIDELIWNSVALLNVDVKVKVKKKKKNQNHHSHHHHHQQQHHHHQQPHSSQRQARQ